MAWYLLLFDPGIDRAGTRVPGDAAKVIAMSGYNGLLRSMGVPLLAATALMVSAGVTPARADTLCSAPGDHPDGLDVSDMQFGVPGTSQADADDCYGVLDTGMGANPATELGFVNDVWDTAGTDPFIFLNKQNEGGANEAGDPLSGITFTLANVVEDPNIANLWTFTLTWDPDEADFVIDFVFLIKAGSGEGSNALYLFEDIDLSGEMSGAGSATIKLVNNGGQTPALSHLSLFGRLSDDDIPGGGGGDIPLPATVWLFGAGLVGLGAIRRRRRR